MYIIIHNNTVHEAGNTVIRTVIPPWPNPTSVEITLVASNNTGHRSPSVGFAAKSLPRWVTPTPAPGDLLGADRLASPASFPILPNNLPHHFQLQHRPSTAPGSLLLLSSPSPPSSRISATVLSRIHHRETKQSDATLLFSPPRVFVASPACRIRELRPSLLALALPFPPPSLPHSRHPFPKRRTNETPSPTSTDIHDTNQSSASFAEKLYFNLHSHSLSHLHLSPLTSHHSPLTSVRSSRSRPFLLPSLSPFTLLPPEAPYPSPGLHLLPTNVPVGSPS